MVKMTRNT